MTAKEWFARGRRLDMHIKSLQATREKLEASAQSTTSRYDGIVVDGTKDPHKFDALVQIEDMIGREEARLMEIKKEIFETICRMPSATEDEKKYRDILMKRYVDCSRWEVIAVEMRFDYYYVKGALHGKALKAAEEFIPDE